MKYRIISCDWKDCFKAKDINNAILAGGKYFYDVECSDDSYCMLITDDAVFTQEEAQEFFDSVYEDYMENSGDTENVL